jgi:hypothetical protein
MLSYSSWHTCIARRRRKRDRKTPSDQGASGREGQSQTLRGSGHRPCNDSVVSAYVSTPTWRGSRSQCLQSIVAASRGVFVLQSKSSVAGSVRVPTGHWYHNLLQPWCLEDELMERWLRHLGVVQRADLKLVEVVLEVRS